MTVIAARKYADRIDFAADSQTNCGDSRVTSKQHSTQKIWQYNGLTVGGAGSAAESQLFRFFCRSHKPAGCGALEIMDLMWEFREWVSKKSESVDFDNQYLIAFGDRLFEVGSDVEVFEVPEFAAVGSGGQIAVTAMHLGRDPIIACETAIEIDCFCGPPVVQLSHKIGAAK